LNFHGSCPVLLTLHFEGRGEVDIEIQKDLAIQPGSQFTMEVNKFLGEKAVSYQMKPMEAKERKKKNGFWAKGKKGGHHQN
jgi:DNA polymerase-3 subunit alpha